MAGEKKFFLGIGGQQSGPYSDTEVNDKITAGEVRGDTLIWYEGLPEWQRLDSIAFFEAALKGGGPAASSEPGKKSQPKNDSLRPVFSSHEAVFFRQKGPRPIVMVGAGVALFALLFLVWYASDEESTIRLPRDIISRKDDQTRVGRLAKAESEFLLNPTVIPEDLNRLISEDAKDEVAQKAIAQLERIFRKKHLPMALANLYRQIGRPADAISPLLEEKAYAEAEATAYGAFQTEADRAKKKALLMKSIELLTGPLQNLPIAITRIQQLEKEFPGEPHPYGYYLLTSERKMSDLFDRTSFFFVESLLTHIKSEFPQIKLAGRPVVSIVRDATGKYRIVGRYKGDVVLSYDKLRGITFEYWMDASEWHLVATNITRERQAWARSNRSKHPDTAQPGDRLLVYLEGVMRTQFPRTGLHERLSREEMAEAARSLASPQ